MIELPLLWSSLLKDLGLPYCEGQRNTTAHSACKPKDMLTERFQCDRAHSSEVMSAELCVMQLAMFLSA